MRNKDGVQNKKMGGFSTCYPHQLAADSPLPSPTCPAMEMDQQSKLLLEKLHHSALSTPYFQAA